MPNQYTKNPTPEERFWTKVDKTESCWLWTAQKDRNGYGYFTVRHGLKKYAHRFAYELVIGPIPAGLMLDHLCRTHACCNPSHLEPVTHRENMARLAAANTTCGQGHPWTPESTLIGSRGTRACRICRAAWHRNRTRKEVLP